jgi:hypothetical protein
MKQVELMVPGDRALFKHSERDTDVVTSDFLEGVLFETHQSEKARNKKAFGHLRRNRSRAYFRGKKKWKTLEVHEGASVREAREFYLKCKENQ